MRIEGASSIFSPRWCPALSVNHLAKDPLPIGTGNLFRGQGDDFRDVVGVEFGERFLELGKSGGGGLENGEDLGGGFQFSLPAVDRLDGWDEIDTGRELPFHEGCANLSRLHRIGEGAKNHQNVTHASS